MNQLARLNQPVDNDEDNCILCLGLTLSLNRLDQSTSFQSFLAVFPEQTVDQSSLFSIISCSFQFPINLVHSFLPMIYETYRHNIEVIEQESERYEDMREIDEF